MRKLLVFTDLDGTLLDHETYSYEAALPAIALLKQHDYPLILNSSKTVVEQLRLRTVLDLDTPLIAENGAAILIPPGQLSHAEHGQAPTIHRFGVPYDELVAQLADLRQQQGYRFRGFADLSVDEVAEITGLSVDEAGLAKQRLASEPLLWDADESEFKQFVSHLEPLGLQTTRGGRFRHVLPPTDKGVAMRWLTDRYIETFPEIEWTVVALGDSPNDSPMLREADIGVLVPNPHRREFELLGVTELIEPANPGPRGWAEAIVSIVRQLS